MSPNDLKQAFDADVCALKHINIGITPAGIYYRDWFKCAAILYGAFLGVMFAACLFASSVGAWNDGDRNLKWSYKFQENFRRYSDESKLPFHPIRSWLLYSETKGLSADEVEAKKAKLLAEEEAILAKEKKFLAEKKKEHDLDFQETLKDQHLIRQAKMVLGILFFPVMPMFFFFLSKVGLYVMFKHQLQAKLKTGDYLVKKMRQIVTLFFIVFGLISLASISLFDQDMTFFAGIPPLLVAGIAVMIAGDMEASRIGSSVISTAIFQYLTKDKTTG